MVPSVSTDQTPPTLHCTDTKPHSAHRIFPYQSQHTQANGTGDPAGSLKNNLSKLLSFVMKLICVRRTIDGCFSEGNDSLYLMSLWCSVMWTLELTFLSSFQFLMFSAGGSQTTQNMLTADRHARLRCSSPRDVCRCHGCFIFHWK